MVRIQIDNRIRALLDNCVQTHHRSLFVIVGLHARDSVAILHEMLSRSKPSTRQSTLLWCYKKDLGFSTNTKKRKRLKKAPILDKGQYLHDSDSFDCFIGSNKIRYCFYSETHSILGQTFGMAILQDFEALTPNLLARVVETVEGGGMILILLQTIMCLKQLYTMAMDVHVRYRTEAYQDIVGRFNERFILSLPTCSDCMILDDTLNLVPLSSHCINIKFLPPKSLDDPKSPEEEELINLKCSLDSSQPVGVLINLCKTLDQAKAVMKFIESLSEKTLRSTVTLTSARGRGKSAALGLAIAGAIAFKYTNIYVTSPHPENLKTLFQFLLAGLDALGYEKTTDYEETRSTIPEFCRAIVKVTVNRKHRQTVKYISPSSNLKIGLVDLVVIDEAAAIPLPLVKSLLGPYLVFLASTINGYEGTGRSLSLKLINQLRKQSRNNQLNNDDLESSKNKRAKASLKRSSVTGRVFHEITLSESIRYSNGDKVEDWLNRLLCLDVTMHASKLQDPPPATECKLYYVNRDTLFSYNKFAELFLQRLVAIFAASHYKNSPNDLMLMSDAPAHQLFCLCPPSKKTLPEILCVVQVCLEGRLPQNTVKDGLSYSRSGPGDLIPWTISQAFLEEDFPALAGARIVRIATHPDHQRKGYGLQALKLLQEFYEGKHVSGFIAPLNMMTPMHVEHEITDNPMEERVETRTFLPPLLFELSQLNPDILHYIGVSYGLSEDLLRFWKKAGFCTLYLGNTPNQLTGEHSCIMLKQLKGHSINFEWLHPFWFNFCEKIIQCLPFPNLADSLALDLISNDIFNNERTEGISKAEIFAHLRPSDCDLLKKFSDDMNFGIPPNYITAVLAQFYFTHRIRECHLTKYERISLFSIGIVLRSYEEVATNLNLTVKQVKQNFGSAVKKVADCILHLCEEE